MTHSWRRPTKTTALVAVTFSLFVGIFAYAKFGVSDSAVRAYDVGQEGYTLTPVEIAVSDFDVPEPIINRFELVSDPADCDGGCEPPAISFECADDPGKSCAETATGTATFERGMVLDLSDGSNDGSWVSSVGLYLYDSTAVTCEAVNSDCNDLYASFLDGTSMNLSMLACPSVPGSPGLISDANPTTDDDSDPTTDSRLDGNGPFTCNNGDFVVVKDDPSDPSMKPLDPSLTFSLTPQNTSAATAAGAYTSTFEDGAKVEMVACMSRIGSSVSNTDYVGLSADLNFGSYSERRAGVPMPQSLVTQYETNNPTTPSCDALSEGGTNTIESGPNTISGFSWVDRDYDSVFTSGGTQNSEDAPFVEFATRSWDVPNRHDVWMVLVADEGTPNERSRKVYLDDDSEYAFENIADGTYRLWVAHTSGNISQNGVGSDPTIDSDFIFDDATWSDDSRIGYADVTVSGGQTVVLWAGIRVTGG